MNKTDLRVTFNKHLIELFEDVALVFPDNTDIGIAVITLGTVKKMNPKLLIEIWKININDIYEESISQGNIDEFIKQDNTAGLDAASEVAAEVGEKLAKVTSSTVGSNVIIEKINILRTLVGQMGAENMIKTLKYIQNLTKLCKVYYN